jgi:hypothetical protein
LQLWDVDELFIAAKVMSYIRRKEKPLFLKNERSRGCFFCKEHILPRVFFANASTSIAVILAMGFICVCAQTYSTGLSSEAKGGKKSICSRALVPSSLCTFFGTMKLKKVPHDNDMPRQLHQEAQRKATIAAAFILASGCRRK